MKDSDIIRGLKNLMIDADLSGNEATARLLGEAIARIEAITYLPKDDGIWSYYRQEMWGQNNA